MRPAAVSESRRRRTGRSTQHSRCRGTRELPGIGPALAERIVEFRDANGPFASLDDLLDVTGTSPRLIEELQPYALSGAAKVCGYQPPGPAVAAAEIAAATGVESAAGVAPAAAAGIAHVGLTGIGLPPAVSTPAPGSPPIPAMPVPPPNDWPPPRKSSFPRNAPPRPPSRPLKKLAAAHTAAVTWAAHHRRGAVAGTGSGAVARRMRRRRVRGKPRG